MIETLGNILMLAIFLPVAALGVFVVIKFLSLVIAALLDWINDRRYELRHRKEP